MQIRKYEKRDWESVCDIFFRAKPDELTGSVEPNSILPLPKDEGLQRSFQDSEMYVAEIEDTVVGFAGFSGSLISFLFVDPNFYRRGIGKKLIERIINEIGEKAWLRVAQNNSNAKELYKRFGFETVEEFTGKYNEINVKVYIMAKQPELKSWKE